MLYHGGYVLTEGHDLKKIEYYYTNFLPKKQFIIWTHNNYSRFAETMSLKPDLVKESPGFALESYNTTSEFNSEARQPCMKNASEELKYLIQNCYNDIVLRMLTEEEKVQIQQYKKEQQGKP